MFDILYTVLIFSGLMIMFKLFERFKVDNLQAIAVNYFVAGLCGVIAMNGQIEFGGTASADTPNPHFFIPAALIIGVLFGIVFNLIAHGTQKIGISITSVANKISLIIPVAVGIWWFNEPSDIVKVAGLAIALPAIYFSTVTGGKLNIDKKYIWLLLFIFMGQGIADTTFKVAQVNCVNEVNSPSFFALIFFASGLTGAIFVVIRLLRKQTKIQMKNILWGILVGIPNYFTLHFFFKALEDMDASQVYPLVNMGVIVFLAFIGLFFFREKLSGNNWIGILLALIAIGLITYSKEILIAFE
jgi:drug/metabolite transporter (DMT)-like permease